jgi:hypothetical protein
MITFILKILILCYLFYTIYSVHNMLKFNSNASVNTIEIPDKDKIKNEIKDKNPLIINYSENQLSLTLDTMNNSKPGYIINDNETLISLDQLLKSEVVTVIDNSKIIEDYNIKEHCNSVINLIKSPLLCDGSYKLSLYRGFNQSKLYKNYREYLLLQSLDGDYTVYLFNPKHENDIKGLEINNTKKWAIKLDMKKENILFIPPEWSYFYQSDNELILVKTESDSIPTWLFNRIRRK